MSSQLASCSSSFAWMKNGMGQDPCTVAAWLIVLCQDPSSNLPAGLAPLQSSVYSSPNVSTATDCTCSWAFYNTIEACTVCQNVQPKGYSDWSSSCNFLGRASNSTYWQSSVSFSSRTKLPRWSIVDPSRWDAGTFNSNQAEQIASQNLPDATDNSASQPSFSSSSSPAAASSGARKANVGAVAGGVVAGILVLIALVVGLWFFVFKRRGLAAGRGLRRHVDLDADGDGMTDAMTGNPFAGHLRSHSLSGSGYSISPTSYHPPLQQTTFQGYPVTTQHGRSQSLPNTLTPYPNQNPRHTNVIQGILRNGNGRTPRESTIPSVAEQLDEKKRLRTGRQSSSGGPPRSRSAYAGIGSRSVSRTGSSGQLTRTSGSRDELNTRSNTAVISHARSQSQSQISAMQGSNTSSLATDIHDINNNNSNPSSVVPGRRPSAGGINKRASHSRRLSLKNAPWNRRRTVMNLGSDAGSETDAGHPVNSIIPSNVDTHGTSAVAPLPLGGMVAAAGHTTTAGDVIAAVPGARLPTARDRENPPPDYTSAA